jgi:hypothetical protein
MKLCDYKLELNKAVPSFGFHIRVWFNKNINNKNIINIRNNKECLSNINN